MKFSPSMLECFAECQKKFFWRYVKNLMKAAPKAGALAWGDAFHKGFQGEPDDDSLPFALGRLAYERCGETAETWEAEGERAYGDMIFTARADGFHPAFVREIKTTSRACADYLNAASMTIQNIMLSLVFSKPVRLTVFKKPTIRLCKNESEAEFKHRALELYRTSDDWLAICDINEPTDDDKREVYALASACWFALHDPGYTFARNCKACYTFRACEFLGLCHDYETHFVEYVQRSEEHKRAHGHGEEE